jgi:hypothetical protein
MYEYGYFSLGGFLILEEKVCREKLMIVTFCLFCISSKPVAFILLLIEQIDALNYSAE